MSWIQTAEPAALAVNFAELKAHLRLTSNDEDTLLDTYARAAIDLVEARTQRAMISRTFRYEADTFPDGEIKLPLAPLVSVQSVQYYDTAGTLTTWAGSNYTTDATSLLGRVVPALGVVYPSTELGRPGAVRVNFTAGYGAAYTNVPAGLRMVVLFLAGHFFTHRVPVMPGGAVEVPETLSRAIDVYKIWSA